MIYVSVYFQNFYLFFLLRNEQERREGHPVSAPSSIQWGEHVFVVSAVKVSRRFGPPKGTEIRPQYANVTTRRGAKPRNKLGKQPVVKRIQSKPLREFNELDFSGEKKHIIDTKKWIVLDSYEE